MKKGTLYKILGFTGAVASTWVLKVNYNIPLWLAAIISVIAIVVLLYVIQSWFGEG